jgi:hypothetical protein
LEQVYAKESDREFKEQINKDFYLYVVLGFVLIVATIFAAVSFN